MGSGVVVQRTPLALSTTLMKEDDESPSDSSAGSGGGLSRQSTKPEGDESGNALPEPLTPDPVAAIESVDPIEHVIESVESSGAAEEKLKELEDSVMDMSASVDSKLAVNFL